MTTSQKILRLKVAESMAAAPRATTRRDVRLPGIRGKAFAVVGVRRCGKTTFLWQCLTDRLTAGRARESQVLLSFEDERLAGLSVADIAWLLDEHARQFPALREVDFLAHRTGERPLLVQVSLETEGDETWERELRALTAAAREHPRSRAFLLTLDAAPPSRPMPKGLAWAPASRWLLEEM